MVIFSGGGQDTFDNAAAKFNEMQDEIELSIQPATGDYNQYLGARAASNDLPDMFWLNSYAQVQQFAGNGYLMDLSDQELRARSMIIPWMQSVMTARFMHILSDRSSLESFITQSYLKKQELLSSDYTYRIKRGLPEASGCRDYTFCSYL